MLASLVNVPGLVLALVLTAPGLYEAYQNPAVDLGSVMLRFVLATVLMSVGVEFVRGLVTSYARGAGRARTAPADHPRRRATDHQPDAPR